MKSVIASLIVAVSSLVLIGCSFDSRSGAFACPMGNECEVGRVCSDGWCVSEATDIDASNLPTPDAPLIPIDADLTLDADLSDAGPPDADNCPSECTSCVGGICLIDCDGANDCAGVVVCPAGVECRVSCAGADSCAAGIDCSAASACRITCSGGTSCAAGVLCGTGLCSIECSDLTSCAGPLDCSNSCQCDTSCAGTCGTNMCPGTAACTSGGTCTSNPGPCNTCI